MNAPCSFKNNIQIRITHTGSRAVLLCHRGEHRPSEAFRMADGPKICICSLDGWMYIPELRDGVNFVGLPLCGEKGSWESAYEDMLIELEFRTGEASTWTRIDTWSDLPLTLVSN